MDPWQEGGQTGGQEEKETDKTKHDKPWQCKECCRKVGGKMVRITEKPKRKC
jgi:hypothetical protein